MRTYLRTLFSNDWVILKYILNHVIIFKKDLFRDWAGGTMICVCLGHQKVIRRSCLALCVQAQCVQSSLCSGFYVAIHLQNLKDFRVAA